MQDLDASLVSETGVDVSPGGEKEANGSVLRTLLVRASIELVGGVSILLQTRHTAPPSFRWSDVPSACKRARLSGYRYCTVSAASRSLCICFLPRDSIPNRLAHDGSGITA